MPLMINTDTNQQHIKYKLVANLVIRVVAPQKISRP